MPTALGPTPLKPDYSHFPGNVIPAFLMQDTVEEADELREEGNALFSRGEYGAACEKYEVGFQFAPPLGRAPSWLVLPNNVSR